MSNAPKYLTDYYLCQSATLLLIPKCTKNNNEWEDSRLHRDKSKVAEQHVSW